ncbi:hypothetical protein N3K66_007334 [Trichothecium roseum]|uniref:Uncharacterized protein n=1 Tax=Trichothecium roseum TaxID=47278 RepID=A0ACC0UTR8_9HYPO|nr:hypothetical protein N3K66_007334 [Trichothecium roseum]
MEALTKRLGLLVTLCLGCTMLYLLTETLAPRVNLFVRSSGDGLAWSSSLPQTTWSASGVLPIFWTDVPQTGGVGGAAYRSARRG